MGIKSEKAKTFKIQTYDGIEIEIPEDIVEEIARIYGYHNLPSKLPEGQIPQEKNISDLEKVIDLKKALKFLGLTEVMTWSII